MSGDGRVEQGLKQGGILSTSIMLTLFMDDKVKMMLKARKWATIDERTVPIIAYADNEVLISKDPTELQALLDIVFQYRCRWWY